MIYPIYNSFRLNLLTKPVHLTLKKTNQKYAELLHQAYIVNGRKEVLGLLHKEAKLQNKLDSNYEN